MIINNFSEFCTALLQCGFSMGGGNPQGIFTVLPQEGEVQEFALPVRWHTGNPLTDPWEWRMRVLEERKDIAYSKVFFRTSGYITKEWYPLFYAVRRRGESFEEAYESGAVSRTAKKIYEIVSQEGEVPLHEIKQLGGFGKEDNAKFERAMVELQMHMFLTMCGRAQKKNKYGEGYGWSSTVFTTVEDFWEKRGVVLPQLEPVISCERIKARILELNPEADRKKIDKFTTG